ncbi:unnamed protein product [Polarella glacialis]|uniref:diacylglycerol O-acyltransferase n=1 Tax=Polarella glacialis TaxID=89957 RepID=A0A813IFE2_POLGL|nr:unnamed protein product [Polarella glacialis]
MSSMGAALERGTWDPEMNMIPPIINGLWFFERAPQLDAVVRMFEAKIWPNFRFHSCMEDGTWVARHKVMDRAYHFSEVAVADEAAIDSYVQTAMFDPLDKDHPPWRMIFLRARTPKNRSAILFRLHHSIGDGLGLLFAFSPQIGCEGGDLLSKIPLPKVMLPPSQQNMAPSLSSSSSPASVTGRALGNPCSCCSAVCAFCRGCSVVLTAQHDSELLLNAPLEERTPFIRFNGQRVHSRFPPVPMSSVKAVCKKHGCTVNDVLMAAMTGALRRYGAEVRGDPNLLSDDTELEFKSMVMIGLPRPIDENDMMSALANNILFASVPLPILGCS